MGFFTRPVRGGSDRMFDYNRDGVLDPNELDAQECFLHDVDSFDELFEDEEEDDDDFEDLEDDDESEDEEYDDSDETQYDSNKQDAFINTNSPEDVLRRAYMEFDEVKGRRIISEASRSGVIFTLKQIANIARMCGDSLLLSLVANTLNHGGTFHFYDLDYIYGEVEEATVSKIVKIWMEHKLPIKAKELYSLEDEIPENLFGQVVRYSQDLGEKFTYDDVGEFMSYMSETQTSAVIDKMLSQNYIFTVDEMTDMDGYVTEKVLSKALAAYIGAGNKVSKQDIWDLDGSVTKTVLTEAFLNCSEEFTPEDLDSLEYSVTKKALMDVIKHQGNIKYDEWKGFSYLNDTK